MGYFNVFRLVLIPFSILAVVLLARDGLGFSLTEYLNAIAKVADIVLAFALG